MAEVAKKVSIIKEVSKKSSKNEIAHATVDVSGVVKKTTASDRSKGADIKGKSKDALNSKDAKNAKGDEIHMANEDNVHERVVKGDDTHH